MPKARSVNIAANASSLNALVECASLCSCVTIRRASSDQHNHPDVDWPFKAAEACVVRMPPFPPAQNAHNVFAIVDHMPLVTSLTVCLVDELSRNATLQLCDLRCIEGLAQAAREQIRDGERMRTLVVYMNFRNHSRPTVLVETHLERLVMPEKRTHLLLRMSSSISLKVSELRGN